MDLNEAKRLAHKEMNRHGLDAAGWTFAFDRAVKRFGQCNFRIRQITLSRHLVELNSKDEVLNTIRHEIAHALAGHQAGHGREWKRVARAIGCDGARTHDAETPEPPFIGTCPGCKREIKKFRRTRVACSRCCNIHSHGKFDSRYAFVWTRTNA